MHFLIRYVRALPSRALWAIRSQQHLYPSWDAAVAAAGPGFQDPRLVATVFERTRLFRDRLAHDRWPVLGMDAKRILVGVARAAVAGGPLRVLDFGGACGAHYFASRAYLGAHAPGLRWHVVETPAMAAAGRALETEGLRFFESMEAAASALGSVDLVLSSGALQAIPTPYAALTALTRLGARHIYLTWLGLTTGDEDLITVQTARLSGQTGPGPFPAGHRDAVIRLPNRLCRKTQVEEILSERYVVDLEWEEEVGAYRPAGHQVDMYGFFATAR